MTRRGSSAAAAAAAAVAGAAGSVTLGMQGRSTASMRTASAASAASSSVAASSIAGSVSGGGSIAFAQGPLPGLQPVVPAAGKSKGKARSGAPFIPSVLTLAPPKAGGLAAAAGADCSAPSAAAAPARAAPAHIEAADSAVRVAQPRVPPPAPVAAHSSRRAHGVASAVAAAAERGYRPLAVVPLAATNLAAPTATAQNALALGTRQAGVKATRAAARTWEGEW